MPTFKIFKNARQTDSIQGADPKKLSDVVKKVASEVAKIDAGGDAGSSSTGKYWLGASLPRNYIDVTESVDVRGLDILNYETSKGTARTLFKENKPTDTDEQILLYIPFQSTLKVHSLHITSIPSSDAQEDDELPSRPKKLKIFVNRPKILGFDDADSMQATQDVELSEKDWDSKTGTANLELRFVKFQSVYSLVLFVAESEGDNEKVRIDRIRIIGETGEKRDGKIEKISHDDD
ncbi:hypothetical protein BT93_L4785 [Corymbia citriodora subsp. variegata]|uniref:PITH domain-containing protein n=1 Tax=Corymbia citriodora subsp. variegata TaxID=360336 RepID=A0A8T0CHL8_CORYI|nr:hypothetical protein BT93_L4785 [Corymbia citriodora subsp. variegata]